MNEKKPSSGVLAGKGFYIALSVCVAMVGAACYFAYDQTSTQLSEQLESLNPAGEQEVDKRETDVPKLTTTHTTTASTTRRSTTTTTTTTTEPPQSATVTARETVPAVVIPATQAAAPARQLPVPGEVVQPFSGTTLVKSKTTGAWQTHNGADLAANLGDAVKAIAAGTVSSVGEDGLWGICVEVNHGDGIVSRYCGLNTGIPVTVGQEVTGGTILGAVGETAELELAEVPHLHFEVLKNGSYLDPVAFVQGE